MPQPAKDLRSNIGTWAIPAHAVPSIAHTMLSQLPTESFDPTFEGQRIRTTYLDTKDFTLRKARLHGDKYLTIRVRQYERDGKCTYALSAKTESQKYRILIDEKLANSLTSPRPDARPPLPPDLLARLIELAGYDQIIPVVTVEFHRYAVENKEDRFTLDVDIATDTGKRMPCNVLEFKSTNKDCDCSMPYRPIKLSKFLWATGA